MKQVRLEPLEYAILIPTSAKPLMRNSVHVLTKKIRRSIDKHFCKTVCKAYMGRSSTIYRSTKNEALVIDIIIIIIIQRYLCLGHMF